MTRNDTQKPSLPGTVRDRLLSVRRRRTWQGTLEAVMAAGATIVVVALLAMAVDWLASPRDTVLRTALTTTVLLATAAVFIGVLARLALSWRRLTAIALDVDRSVPDLQERWSTVTELAQTKDPASMRGSENLLAHVSAEAESLTGRVRVGRVVSSRPLLLVLGCLTGALVVAGVVFAYGGRDARVLLSRLARPTADVSLTELTSLTGDAVVPIGEPLALRVADDGRRHPSALLAIRSENGEQRTIELSRRANGDAAFEHSIAAVRESFDYRVSEGDGRTPWHRVTAVDPPVLAEVRFRVAPPEYLETEATESAALPRRHVAIEGSSLRLAMRASKPVPAMELRFARVGSRTVPVGEDGWCVFETELAETVAFAIHMTDEHGVANRKPKTCRIVVRPDRPPVVKIVDPNADIVVTPDAEVPVRVVMRDDQGLNLETARLDVMRTGPDGEEELLDVIPLETRATAGGREGSPTRAEGRTTLDLKKYDVEHGQKLTYVARVSDRRQSSSSQQARIAEGTPPGQGQQSQQASEGDPGGESSGGRASEGQELADSGDGQSGERSQNPKHGFDDHQDPNDDRGEQSGSQQARSGQGENQDVPGSPSSKSNQPCQAASQEGAQPSPGKMTQRYWPGGGACSSTAHITVDKYAGEYEGQRRRKLQMAVDRILARVDAALAAAEGGVDPLAAHVRERKPWVARQDAQLTDAQAHVAAASKEIDEAAQVSSGTPYAFVGLTLRELGVCHVTPAAEQLKRAASLPHDPAPQQEALETALLEIIEARAKLARLTSAFQELARQENLAEKVAHFKKVHQMFVEDLAKILKPAAERLNPRGKKTNFAEFSDEEAEKLMALLQERYAKLKELMADLAKALEDDPVLLRRFMASMRNGAMTLRDQLTVLARRQGGQFEQTRAWVTSGEQRRDAALKVIDGAMLVEQEEIAASAREMIDAMETWMPRTVDQKHAAVKRCFDEARRVTLATHRVAAVGTPGELDAALPEAEALMDRLGELEVALMQLYKGAPDDPKVAVHGGRRAAEVRMIGERQRQWVRRVKAAHAGDYGKAAMVGQGQLVIDTLELDSKLDGAAAKYAGISPEIGQGFLRLRELLGEKIIAEQREAGRAFGRKDVVAAADHQQLAVSGYAEAEQVFDDLLTKIEDSFLRDGVAQAGAPGALPPMKTLEELLRALEDEEKALETLGLACIATATNLMLMLDWMSPEEGAGQGAGQGQGAGMGQGMSRAAIAQQMLQQALQRMQQAGRISDQELARLRAEAKRLASELGEQPGEGSGRRWDTLVSRLRRDLRQGRGTTPPEQYRAAIEDYFRTVAAADDEAARAADDDE